ncbi:hypothetical protein DIS24_g4550 [Lasiodiplodia hormozganensis]|uniref:Uncharacterized protein n=1 Tax=Lasiodiplodia hormozganensis TaxID=869390 RepID=A0AA39YTZ2_9PEZI|nr:hypothetical protein DIS24_g4550 [Lasiodiplodia hormozganensis]
MSAPDQHPLNNVNKQMQVSQEGAFSNASQPANGIMQLIHHATEPMEGVIEHAPQPADGVAFGGAPHPQNHADEHSFPQQSISDQGTHLQSGRVDSASPQTMGPVAYNQNPQSFTFGKQSFPPNPYQQHIVNNYASTTGGAREGQDNAGSQESASSSGAFQNPPHQLSGHLRQMQAFDAHEALSSQANDATQDPVGAADAPSVQNRATHHRSESMEGIINNAPQPQNRAFEHNTPSESQETDFSYQQLSDGPGSASSPSKSIENGQGEDNTTETLRELREVAYTIAHPPKSAFQTFRIIRSFLRRQFPRHFRADKRIIKVGSPLIALGRERLNISELMWNSMMEEDIATRPEMPMKIEQRQIVRCDEQHSLEDHSPAGTASIACAKCPPQKFDSEKNPSSRYMMCLACIGQHEKALAEHNTMLAGLICGSAWARLCEDCQEKCNQFKPCSCEWEVPLCLGHRRKHLEELMSRAQADGYILPAPMFPLDDKDPKIEGRAIGDPKLADPYLAAHEFRPWCGHCWHNDATTGISYAWKCFICMGYFVLPNDVPSTWFPHMAPPEKNRNCEEETETSQEGSSASTDFDFTL